MSNASRRRRPSAPSIETQRFFESKRAGAVLKHAILSGYLVPFASKTGSSSIGNRVVVVDGYAGAGRYDSGEPGSPALIAEAARGLRGRSVEALFIEKDPEMFGRLQRLLEDEEDGEGLSWEAWQGTVEDNLDEVLDRADGVPLFLFLDPFGLGLPFDVIVNIFDGRPSGTYAPATEVLFRFDASAIRRIRGVLHAGDFPARAGQLAALDRAAGGTWWQDEDDQALGNEAYVEWFMGELLEQICSTAHCTGWITDVRHRSELQPAYYLMFLTRHRDGMEVFAEALSLAQGKWRRAVFDDAIAGMTESGQELLFDPNESFEDEEIALSRQWHDRIRENVLRILEEEGSFVVRTKLSEIYGNALGIARTTHLRGVLKELHRDGTTSSDSKGDLFGKRVVPST